MSDIKKLIGVFTTKGGVGKTTIALNLAYLLSDVGRTLLVEMDRNHTLTAMLKMEMDRVSSYVRTGEVKSKVGQLGVLSLNGKEAGAIWKDFFDRAVDIDYVVFDFHNAITGEVIVPLQRSDLVIVPTVPTMAGLGAYIHTRKNLDRLNVEYLGIANMVSRGLFGVVKEERVLLDKMRGMGKFWGYIPRDRSVVKAGIEHRVVVERYPNSPFSKAMGRLVMEVM